MKCHSGFNLKKKTRRKKNTMNFIIHFDARMIWKVYLIIDENSPNISLILTHCSIRTKYEVACTLHTAQAA